jgi:hypothetical protein
MDVVWGLLCANPCLLKRNVRRSFPLYLLRTTTAGTPEGVAIWQPRGWDVTPEGPYLPVLTAFLRSSGRQRSRYGGIFSTIWTFRRDL